MTQTPIANRKHISIFGNTNSGKSTLFNLILGQDAAIVSSEHGTTTDPVTKAMELIPFGPVALIDTAGINDKTALGDARVKRTRKILGRTDLAIYLSPASGFSEVDYDDFKNSISEYNTPHILVFSKSDLASDEDKKKLKNKFSDALFVSFNDQESVDNLKTKMSEILSNDEKEDTILGDLLPAESTVLMVVPVDSEAPKGRLILPQVQLIRDCLDNGFKISVCRDSELPQMMENLKNIDLVVTDSQAFNLVSKIVPDEIMLTSFSILFGRHKGDLMEYVKGIEAVKKLKSGDRIAITEGCTHNHTHEDIGRVKIPNWLKREVGAELNFEFFAGLDFPENPSEYDLVVQCGGCMQNRREIMRRINACKKANVPITNYGILIAHINSILKRSIEVLNK